jgi:hypothetical protein
MEWGPGENMSPSEFIAIVPTLRVGDLLTITTDSGARSVTVTEIDGDRVYTSSGKVRPGRVGGGYLRVFEDVVYFQPTMAQQNRRVVSVARSNVVAFRRAA